MIFELIRTIVFIACVAAFLLINRYWRKSCMEMNADWYAHCYITNGERIKDIVKLEARIIALETIINELINDSKDNEREENNL